MEGRTCKRWFPEQKTHSAPCQRSRSPHLHKRDNHQRSQGVPRGWGTSPGTRVAVAVPTLGRTPEKERNKTAPPAPPLCGSSPRMQCSRLWPARSRSDSAAASRAPALRLKAFSGSQCLMRPAHQASQSRDTSQCPNLVSSR